MSEDKKAISLKSFDLRKFTKLMEFKLSTPVASLILLEDGMKLLVSAGKLCLCKEIEGEIRSIIEFNPKEKKLTTDLKAEVIKDQTYSSERMRFLMNSRNDLVELVEVHID